MVMQNKKGWIRILEVFIAISLLAGVLTIILQSQETEEGSQFQEIYEKQHTASKIIQMNQSLRADALTGQVSKGINSTLNKTLPNMECKTKICGLDQQCPLDENIEEEIYAQTTQIFANETHYKPKNLRIFCW